MRRTVIIAMLLLMGLAAQAQQDPMYSMYMFNGLAFNPAYAGSRETVSFTLFAREQWVGMAEAPATQSFTMHAPSRDLHHGWGFSVVNDKTAYTRNFRGNFTYAYRIHLGEYSRLAFGLQGGVDHYRVNLSGVDTWDNNDPAFLQGDFTRILPVAGTGVYFNSRYFYLGLSTPNFLPGDLFDPYYETLEARRSTHAFLNSGVVIPLGKALKLKPSVLVKYARGAPLSLDLNGAILIRDLLWLGVSYRPNRETVFMVELNITPSFRIGYAYDRVNSALSTYTDGSHELMLGFDLSFKKEKVISPRLF